jgi:hypothetical protein
MRVDLARHLGTQHPISPYLHLSGEKGTGLASTLNFTLEMCECHPQLP